MRNGLSLKLSLPLVLSVESPDVSHGHAMPDCRLYNDAGVLLRAVTIPELEGIRGLQFCFLNGMLAYDYAPVDYPKIYLLDF